LALCRYVLDVRAEPTTDRTALGVADLREAAVRHDHMCQGGAASLEAFRCERGDLEPFDLDPLPRPRPPFQIHLVVADGALVVGTLRVEGGLELRGHAAVRGLECVSVAEYRGNHYQAGVLMQR